MDIREYGSGDDPRRLLLAPMLVIRPGFQHCGDMAAHPKEYAEEIESFIGRRQDVLG